MSQEQYKNDNKKLPKFSNRGEGDNSPRKGPRFSIYWVYAIIFALLIGMQVFNPFSSGNSEIDQSQFMEMVKNGDITNYTIISNRQRVRVKLREDALKKWEKEIGK